jgi:hypothetical protein|tara:strand:+ start:1163 stop:1357 length:195 start_codon:yes stop_codon:yes gene_type:complete
MASPRVRRLRRAARANESKPAAKAVVPAAKPAAKPVQEVSKPAAPVQAAAPAKKVNKTSAKKAD